MGRAVPTPPSDLSAAARAIWQTVHREWDVDTASRVLLVTALRAYDRCELAREMVAKEGMVIPVGNTVKPHPAIGIWRSAETAFIRCWRQLAFDAPPPGPMGRPAGRGTV